MALLDKGFSKDEVMRLCAGAGAPPVPPRSGHTQEQQPGPALPPIDWSGFENYFRILSAERKSLVKEDVLGRRNTFDAVTFTAESQSNLMAGMNLFMVYFYDDQGFEVGMPSIVEMSQPTGLNTFFQPGMKVRGSFILPSPETMRRVVSIKVVYGF